MSLPLHATTQGRVEAFVERPSHALLLTGPGGSGKAGLAAMVAQRLLGLDTAVNDYPYSLSITPSGGKAIGIEAIRQLEHFLSLKVPHSAAVNRAVIIHQAHLMTLEAQNAFLKTLEEPPAGTVLILTAHQATDLLPTLQSRVQTVSVQPPNKAQLQAHFEALGFSPQAINKVYNLGAGLPGLMQALLEADVDHPLRQATDQARQLLSQSSFERLLAVDALAKQRPLLLDTLFILQHMAHLSLQTATGRAAKRWQAVLQASYEATEAIHKNAQPKLVVTKLMLEL